MPSPTWNVTRGLLFTGARRSAMSTKPTFVPIPPLNDAGGWYLPQYYTTIRYADVDGDGRAELLARGAAGIQVWDLDRSRLWAGWPAGTEITDADNWLQPQYYST